MERIRTLVLVVIESSLHMSPTHNKRLCGGMEFLLKVLKTYGTNISSSTSYVLVPVYIEIWVHALNEIIPLVSLRICD